MTRESSESLGAMPVEGEERHEGFMAGNSYALLVPAERPGRMCPRPGMLVAALAFLAVGTVLLMVQPVAIHQPRAGRLGWGDESALALQTEEMVAKAEVTGRLRAAAFHGADGDDEHGHEGRGGDEAAGGGDQDGEDRKPRHEGRGGDEAAGGGEDGEGRKPRPHSKAPAAAFLPAKAPAEHEAHREKQAPARQETSSPWGWFSAFAGSVAGIVDNAAMSLHLMTSTSTSTATATSTTTTQTTTTTTHTRTTTTSTSHTSTSTTVTTSTYTTTSTRLATLFCFAVIRIAGYEPPLMEQLYYNKASLFDCEDVALYSTGGTILVGSIATVEIVAPVVNMGNLSQSGTTTSSWLNTKIFMMAWDLVLKDGRWWNHEWTVKVDPDAVFFPHRLKVVLYPYYTAGVTDGPALYVADCDRTWNGEPPSLKIYGSLEVYSRNAIGMYNHDHLRCERELTWKGWGEDFYMQMCLDKLGVSVVNGVSWVSDINCYQVACTDVSKVAYHAYKDVNQYLDCWRQSRGVEDSLELKKQDMVIFKQ